MIISYLVGQLLLGWLAADFASGIFHWIQDRFIGSSVPIFGPLLGAPARLHHVKPLAFLEGSFLHRNGYVYGLAAVTGIACLVLFGPSFFLVTFVAGIAISTQAHFWTHCPKDAPEIARMLQDIGLLQSPKQHSRHHAPPQDTHYCALSSMVNPILEAIGFWPKLERLIGFFGLGVCKEVRV